MGLLKYIYIFIGFLFLGIGMIGIILPVLPTTPFLLVTAFCFVRGSERFHNWFLNTRLYEKHLRSYVDKREMALKTKLSILSLATIMISIAIFFIDIFQVRIILLAVIGFHWWYFFFRIKTR